MLGIKYFKWWNYCKNGINAFLKQNMQFLIELLWFAVRFSQFLTIFPGDINSQ